MKLSVIAVFAAAALLVGCSSGGTDTNKAVATSKPKTTAAPGKMTEPAKEKADKGTEKNPYAIGTPVRNGDWEVTVNSWQPNINDAVVADGGDLSMLPEGQQYALMNVTMTWRGAGVGDNSQVNLQYMPEGGNSLSASWSAYGKTPGGNKLAYEELVTDGSVTGDMLYAVDAGNTKGTFMWYAPNTEQPVYIAAQ
ncbi:hypothetical protein G7068_13915 [Leucobacter viscericola]|uniref:DUF4352 domain-containing protein n=1 Tax=Leucobacter viscericola TaxID=2714935 RepID=A0A6G7XI33_9MICO|nr:hypothetical protein [Leucobacter viscericola]QIK64172.1 hypothetical protein G7068_13915 [Leucobacter viscericola]